MAAVAECLLLQLLLVVFIPVPSIFSLPVENHLDDGSLGKRYALMKGIWQKENCFFPSAELYGDTVSVPSDGFGGILSAGQPRDTGIGLRACSVDQTSDDNLSFRSTLCGTFFNLSQQFCHELKKPDRETEMEYLSLSKLGQLVKERGLLPLCNETKKVSERLRISIMKPVFQIEDSCGQCAEDEELGQVCSILFSSILNYVEAVRKKKEAADRRAAARTGSSGTGTEAAGGQGNEAGAAGSGVAGQGGGGPGGDKLPDGEGRPPMEGGGLAGGTGGPQAGASSRTAGTGGPAVPVDKLETGVDRPTNGADGPAAGTGGPAVPVDKLETGVDRPTNGADGPAAGTGGPAVPVDKLETGVDRPTGGMDGSAEGGRSLAGLGEEGRLREEAGRLTSPEGEGQPPGTNPALTAFSSTAGGPGDKPLMDTRYPGGKLLVDTNNGGASLNTMTGGSSSVLKANERGGLSQPTELAQPPGDGPGRTGGQNFGGAGGKAAQPSNNGFLEDGAGRVGDSAGDPVLTRPGGLHAPDALNTLGAQQGNGNILIPSDGPVDQNHQGQQGGGNIGDGVGNGGDGRGNIGDGRGNIGDGVGNGGDGMGNGGDGRGNGGDGVGNIGDGRGNIGDGVGNGGDGRGNIGDGRGNIGDGVGNGGDGMGNGGDGRGNIGDGRGNVGDGRGNIGDGRGNIGDGRGNVGDGVGNGGDGRGNVGDGVGNGGDGRGNGGDGVGNGGDGVGNGGDGVGNGGDGGGNGGEGVGITAGKPPPGQGLPPNSDQPGNNSPWSTEGRLDNELDREEEDDEDAFWEKANGNQGVLGDGRGQDVEAPLRKPPVQKVPDIPPDGVQSLGNALQHPYEESSPSGHFMAYFITAVILCVAGYVIYHNKQKIFAIALEGRRDSQRRRPASGGESSSSAKYSKLQSTVEEVVPALEKSTSSKNYIY